MINTTKYKKSYKGLICGPFLGDFKQEIMTFIPYINYIKYVLNYKKMYINSHYNRRFLYDDNDIFVPVNQEFTHNENKQINYYYSDVNKKKYQKLFHVFRDHILLVENLNKNELKNVSLSYIKSNIQRSSYEKIYNQFKIPNIKFDTCNKNTIIFIPDNSSDEKICEQIYTKLKDKYTNVIVLGDKKIHLLDENRLIYQEDYNENVYKYILKALSTCKCVITPSSHWTFLCNLQNVPVFSWGLNSSIYKSNQYLGFNNLNSIFMCDEDIETNKIINQMCWFIDKL